MGDKLGDEGIVVSRNFAALLHPRVAAHPIPPRLHVPAQSEGQKYSRFYCFRPCAFQAIEGYQRVLEERKVCLRKRGGGGWLNL